MVVNHTNLFWEYAIDAEEKMDSKFPKKTVFNNEVLLGSKYELLNEKMLLPNIKKNYSCVCPFNLLKQLQLRGWRGEIKGNEAFQFCSRC